MTVGAALGVWPLMTFTTTRSVIASVTSHCTVSQAWKHYPRRGGRCGSTEIHGLPVSVCWDLPGGSTATWPVLPSSMPL
eukprot:1559164-Pyramimonas_sp.AAC.1